MNFIDRRETDSLDTDQYDGLLDGLLDDLVQSIGRSSGTNAKIRWKIFLVVPNILLAKKSSLGGKLDSRCQAW